MKRMRGNAKRLCKNIAFQYFLKLISPETKYEDSFFCQKTYFSQDFGFEGVACSTLPPCRHENERKKFWGKMSNFLFEKRKSFS